METFFNYDVTAKEILKNINSLTGNFLPYNENENLSFGNFTENKNLSKDMFAFDKISKKKPYDIIYANNIKSFPQAEKELSTKGKIYFSCQTNKVKEIVKEANKFNLSWAEWKEKNNESAIIFRKKRKFKNQWKKNGKGSVFLYSDWGWGDLFQNLRYIKTIQKEIGKIIIEADENSQKLLSEIFKIDTIKKGENYPKTKYSLEICDCEKYFGFLNNKPYINIPKKQKNKKFQTGIAWKGHHLSFNKQRNINDAELFKKFLICNNSLHCIQKFTEKTNIPNFIKTHSIKNWYETAKLINNMDLIITVDTSVAHLSGALGKETWVILSNKNYYTPINKIPNWYSTVKIYKDTKNWSIIDQISDDLYSKLTIKKVL